MKKYIRLLVLAVALLLASSSTYAAEYSVQTSPLSLAYGIISVTTEKAVSDSSALYFQGNLGVAGIGTTAAAIWYVGTGLNKYLSSDIEGLYFGAGGFVGGAGIADYTYGSAGMIVAGIQGEVGFKFIADNGFTFSVGGGGMVPLMGIAGVDDYLVGGSLVAIVPSVTLNIGYSW